jgi:hypothetical protein
VNPTVSEAFCEKNEPETAGGRAEENNS